MAVQRRQTLGPLSASALNSRMSLGPNVSNAAVLAPKTLAKARQSLGPRASLAPTASRQSLGVSRQSLAASRQSIGGRNSLNRNSSSGKSAPTRQEKDPRDIGNKAHTQQNIRILLNYLISHDYNQPLTPKQLTGPTQRDFMTIVTFLFHKIDPNFSFGKDKKPDDEILQYFKTLGYPYNISKCSLQSVGAPHTWPAILAALTWLIELLSFGEDSSEMKNELDLDVNRDRLYFDKLAHAYGIFMQGGDDEPYLEQELAATFVAENEALSSELEAFEKDIKAVEQETADLESSQPPISKLNDLLERSVVERDLLAGDLQAAENDLKISEAKLIALQNEVDIAESEAANLRKESQALIELLEAQELVAPEVARMTHEKLLLEDTVAALSRQRDDLNRRTREAEANIKKHLELVQRNVSLFNELASNLQILPFGSRNSPSFDMELRYNDQAVSMKELLNLELKLQVKPVLTKLKEDFTERIKQLNRDVREQGKRAENMKETFQDKSEELKQMQARYGKLETAYKEEREMMNKELTRQVSEVEDIELDLRRLQNNQTDAVQQLQNTLEKLQAESEHTEKLQTEQRAELERQVCFTIELVTQHKIYVSSKLDELARRTKRVKESVM